MDRRNDGRRRFRVIPGGLSRDVSIGGCLVTVSSQNPPPFPIEAVAAEEDTWLVLSAPPVVEDPGEHLIRTMTTIMDTLPLEPGTAVLKKGKPLKLLAVVHDLEQEPSLREEWVVSALKEVLALTLEKGCQTLALPIIAATRGPVSVQRFIDILRGTLLECEGLKKLWLVVPQGTEGDVVQLLQAG